MASANLSPSSNKTIVWEYESDIPGIFAPFTDKVSNYIEDQYTQNPNNAIILRHIDPSLSNYSIDTSSMMQVNTRWGTGRPVQRMLYDHNTALSCGVTWEWMADRGWTTYDTDTLNEIEAAYSNNDKEVDLSTLKCGLPNVVFFDKGYQMNKNTRFVRAVQRKTVAYKTITGTLSNAVPSSTSSNGVSSQNNVPSRKRTYGAPVKPPYPGTTSSSHPRSTATPNGTGLSGSSASGSNDDGVMKFCDPVAEVEGDDAECAICLVPFKGEEGDSDSATEPVVQLNKCKHYYHKSCMEALYKQSQNNGCIQCPICKTIHGIKMGNQPPGKMNVTFDMRKSVSGYQGDGMIIITYQIHSGTQGPNDPNPGVRYHAQGFPRTAYLPANAKGKKVLKLLKIAWERRLIFTIGTSITTGRDNSVVWNEIHHKTSPVDDGSGHGFPDPGYLDNVIDEMKQHGIVDDGTP